ncbi:MAG: peroxidase, partial [Silicimonas sp.]|nr:peroxidase [Silicimonas sp.]
MAFIDAVPRETADAATAALYQAEESPDGHVPNYVLPFTHAPDVYAAWNALSGALRERMVFRRYELATLGAARALNCSYCMLAHGSRMLAEGEMDADALAALVENPDTAPLTNADRAVLRFAAMVARDATAITEGDVQALRDAGLVDREIFDVSAAAAARCFFSKVLDSLGVEADASLG